MALPKHKSHVSWSVRVDAGNPLLARVSLATESSPMTICTLLRQIARDQALDVDVLRVSKYGAEGSMLLRAGTSLQASTHLHKTLTTAQRTWLLPERDSGSLTTYSAKCEFPYDIDVLEVPLCAYAQALESSPAHSGHITVLECPFRAGLRGYQMRIVLCADPETVVAMRSSLHEWAYFWSVTDLMDEILLEVLDD